MKKIIFSISILLIFTYIANSQSISLQVVASAGGYSSTDAGSIAWTLGEPVVETYSNSEIILTQGFNQPFFSIETFVEENSANNIKINLFPNPASDFVIIDAPEEVIDGNFSLYTIDGKIVTTKNITSDKTKIDLKGFLKSSYILKIYDKKGNAMKSFKIQKIE